VKVNPSATASVSWKAKFVENAATSSLLSVKALAASKAPLSVNCSAEPMTDADPLSVSTEPDPANPAEKSSPPKMPLNVVALAVLEGGEEPAASVASTR
jgi:hypothetical protein